MSRLPTVMGHSFAQVPSVSIPRSQFDRSCGKKFTMDAGLCVPFWHDKIYPGDTYNVQPQVMLRMTTPLRPIMDNLYCDVHWFFVPDRLVWDNFEYFMGAQENPDDPTDFLIPQIDSNSTGFTVASLGDYFGLPVGVAIANPSVAWKCSSLPFRGYTLIWNQWYRDENQQDSHPLDKGDGPESASDFEVLPRGKRHDYFTSCLPFAQKGTAVSLPLGTTAPVIGIGIPTFQASPSGGQGGRLTAAATAEAPAVNVDSPSSSWTAGQLLAWQSPELQVNLASATAATINQLRNAISIQQLMERDARGGTRYTEIIRAHFRVVSPDARLQRAEYLGGGTFPINTSPVAQNSASPATPTINDGLGVLGAVGTGGIGRDGGAGFVKSFVEHGYVFGILSVRADLTYQQGVDRDWIVQTKHEMYWPDLANIGEQAVRQVEIFASEVLAENETVFGYQEPYAHLRYKASHICGLFRSNVSGSLDVWHLSQDFAAAPELGPDFIVENPPIDRVIAVPTQPHFYVDTYVSCKAARPLPLFGVPGLRRL